jgi:hypothetical protein
MVAYFAAFLEGVALIPVIGVIAVPMVLHRFVVRGCHGALFISNRGQVSRG